jgi:hypothetical protein
MRRLPLSLFLAAGILAVGTGSAFAQAVGTSFTYQGKLDSLGAPTNGPHDLKFRLFDATSGGAQVGPELCVNDVSVVDGQFTILLDFGTQFSGAQRHIEIDVRADTGLTCADQSGYETLAPRQNITPAPYALFALNGNPGPQGEIGPAGPQGAAGAQGIQGIQGIPGLNGTNGATGAQGPQGPIGATGATGPAGANGAAGPAGPQGATGATPFGLEILPGSEAADQNQPQSGSIDLDTSHWQSFMPSVNGRLTRVTIQNDHIPPNFPSTGSRTGTIRVLTGTGLSGTELCSIPFSVTLPNDGAVAIDLPFASSANLTAETTYTFAILFNAPTNLKYGANTTYARGRAGVVSNWDMTFVTRMTAEVPQAELTGAVVVTGNGVQSGIITAEQFVGNGAGLTNVTAVSAATATNAVNATNATNAVNATNATNATQLNGQPASFYTNAANLSGSLADARLSSNVPLKNVANTFTNSITATSFIGDGSGLTSLQAHDIVTGNLNAARMPTGGSWSLNSPLNLDSSLLVIDPANSRVGIRVAVPASPLHVGAPNIGSANLWMIRITNTLGGTGGIRMSDDGFLDITNVTSGANFARLNNTGNWSAVSDARLKTDVTTSHGHLASALKLRPVHFRWKESAQADFGFIAQEVREVLPELVVGDESKTTLTVNYAQMSAVAIGAIQELKAENDRKQQEIDDLKARIAAIESMSSNGGLSMTQTAGLSAGVGLPLLAFAAFRRRKVAPTAS